MISLSLEIKRKGEEEEETNKQKKDISVHHFMEINSWIFFPNHRYVLVSLGSKRRNIYKSIIRYTCQLRVRAIKGVSQTSCPNMRLSNFLLLWAFILNISIDVFTLIHYYTYTKWINVNMAIIEFGMKV